MTTPFLRPSPPTGSALLKLRGGGGGGDFLGLSKDAFARSLVAYYGLNGAIGMPAPEVISKQYGGTGAAPNSLAEIFWTFIGSGCAGLALMFYQSYFTDAGVGEIAVSSSHPCLFVAWKFFLQKTFQKAGCKESTGPLVLASFVPMLLLLTGWGGVDEGLLVKIMSGIVMLIGVTAWLGGNDLAKSMWGCTIADGKQQQFPSGHFGLSI
jgi:hypothetical protein